jgi:uncharacterized delta-60 repeat protein
MKTRWFVACSVVCGWAWVTACVGDTTVSPTDSGGDQTTQEAGSGDAGNDASTQAFSLSAPTTVTLGAGKSATLALTVTRNPPFTGAIVITTQGAPAGITVDPLTIASTDPGGVLTLHAAANATAATASMTIIGTSGTLTANTTTNVTISPGPGVQDTTFGSGGTVDTTSGSAGTQPNAVVIQPDDKIVVGATLRNGSTDNFVLYRYTKDGALDVTFNGSGASVTTVPGILYGLTIQSDGKLVAVGTHSLSSSNAFQVARYNTDGTLDTSFGTSGTYGTFQYAGSPTSGSTAYGVAMQSDGKIVVVGYQDGYDGADDGIVLRLTSAGALDTTFGKQAPGYSFAPGNSCAVSSGGARFYDVKVQSSGEIVAGGYFGCDTPASNHYYVMGFSTAGAYNPSFYGFAGQLQSYQGVEALALDANENIIAVGNVPSYKMAIQRDQAADGQIDSLFGTSGSTITNLTGYDDTNRVVIQSDGAIVACGTTGGSSSSTTKVAIIRYAATGAVDTTFGTGGNVQGIFAAPSSCGGVGVQKDGRIVVVGDQIASAAHHIRIARYWP